MKVSKIIADIDYVEPKGSLKEFKYGVSQKELYSKYKVPSNEFEAKSDIAVFVNAEVIDSSTSKLKEDLKGVAAYKPLVEPKADLVGKE